jgi:hypothetical protein
MGPEMSGNRSVRIVEKLVNIDDGHIYPQPDSLADDCISPDSQASIYHVEDSCRMDQIKPDSADRRIGVTLNAQGMVTEELILRRSLLNGLGPQPVPLEPLPVESYLATPGLPFSHEFRSDLPVVAENLKKGLIIGGENSDVHADSIISQSRSVATPGRC